MQESDRAANVRWWLCAGLVALVLGSGSASAEETDSTIPWPRQYKIKPDQKDRLTAADVVGPDGIVYPELDPVRRAGRYPDGRGRGERRGFRGRGR